MNDVYARLAPRMKDIAAFHVMAVLARAQEIEATGRTVIHMEIGEPDFPTPEPVWRAAQTAIEGGQMFYTAALGLPQLRAAIAGHYRTRYGVDVSPERIVVTSGSSGALLLAIAILVGRDDEVLLADPGYPANRHFVRMMEGTPVGIPVGADTGYQLTADLIAAHWSARTAAALVATPSNPTGTLIPDDELGAMARVVTARGGALLVDEIYHGLVYGDHPRTALSLDGNVFVINSFSKYFNMTGWRLGWLVAPESSLDALNRLSQNVYLSAPTPSQHAALAAFTPETTAILEERRREFQRRRDYLVPALRDLGFVVPQEPGGAFYVYADCSAFTDDSFRFAMNLLEEAGVAITPGIDFGDHLPQRHVRFAYTRPVEQLAEGVARIARFVGR
jgi:aspartate/methionine/tyrosine aminotransferase